ncbi:MAG: hypothetical protein M0003_03530 [Acidithiobacillus sp.]|nr:hypothetical protein [Acidithiobacillus sp.]
MDFHRRWLQIDYTRNNKARGCFWFCRSQSLWALDTTGKVRWQQKVSHAFLTRNNHRIMAFNAQSGLPAWNYLSKDIVTSPTPEGTGVYLGTDGRKIVAILTDNEERTYAQEKQPLL